MSGSAQKRGLEVKLKNVTMSLTRKSDRQGLNIIPGYEDDTPLPEYRPPAPRPDQEYDPGLNTINVDSLEPETVGAVSSEQPAITDIVPDPATFLDQTFDSLPFSQK